MNVFIISSVRNASLEYVKMLDDYVVSLEAKGKNVYLPHRDTDQRDTGLNICKKNREAIRKSDEIHIFYSSGSQGTHFDMGMAFAMNKKIVVIENEKYGEGKSYPRMLDEWQAN